MKSVKVVFLFLLALLTGSVVTFAAQRYELIYWGHYVDMSMPPNPCPADVESSAPFVMPNIPGVFVHYRCTTNRMEFMRYFPATSRYPAPGTVGIPVEVAEVPPPPPQLTPGCPTGFVVGRSGGCVPPNHPEAQ